MPQEDLLKKQIDKMARALGKILGLTLDLDIPDSFEQTSERLKTELDFDLDEIAGLPDDVLIATLTTRSKLNNGHLSTLADIIYNTAGVLHKTDTPKAKVLFKKASLLYEYLARAEKSYSFEWHTKLKTINKILQ